jgi:hypothetical protein
MRNIIEWAGRVVLSLSVVFALGFGAQQALGISSRLDDCQPCYSQSECNECCQLQSGECGFCTVTNACLCFECP